MADAVEKENVAGPAWELRFGCSLAVLAAVLAVNDLGGSKYGGDELQLSNEKTSAYLWYQSKGIKESLASGQRALLTGLLAGGAVRNEARGELTAQIGTLEKKVARYEKEQAEILKGSAAVGSENWVQDVDGALGKVVGAKEIEQALTRLGDAGDRFDLANLFLQLSLVIGAIGIILRGEKGKRAFLGLMITLGGIGAVCCVLAYVRAMGV